MSARAKQAGSHPGKGPLCEHVRDSLQEYFAELNGHEPSELYDFVLSEVEQPLFAVVMKHTGGNQTQAARMLGISRATLRKKLRRYGLD